jgi:DNA-binding XRE family transcriptional regulator
MVAYEETYLRGATKNLGNMFDYAVNDLCYDCDEFMHMFIVAGIAEQFGRGNPTYVAGKSGFELADEVVWITKRVRNDWPLVFREDKTPEYWAGWIIAQYQWQYGATFPTVQRLLPISRVVLMYHPLHEVDVTNFFEVANESIKRSSPITNLRYAREKSGYSQSKLACKAGVNLRSIQMYEQRRKHINNAQAMTLANLSRVLGCNIEDLLETIG